MEITRRDKARVGDGWAVAHSVRRVVYSFVHMGDWTWKLGLQVCEDGLQKSR
jgi:hypothetical protein